MENATNYCAADALPRNLAVHVIGHFVPTVSNLLERVTDVVENTVQNVTYEEIFKTRDVNIGEYK